MEKSHPSATQLLLFVCMHTRVHAHACVCVGACASVCGWVWGPGNNPRSHSEGMDPLLLKREYHHR